MLRVISTMRGYSIGSSFAIGAGAFSLDVESTVIRFVAKSSVTEITAHNVVPDLGFGSVDYSVVAFGPRLILLRHCRRYSVGTSLFESAQAGKGLTDRKRRAGCTCWAAHVVYTNESALTGM